MEKNSSHTPMPAAELFRYNRHHIELLDNGNWMLRFRWGDFEHPIHYNVESLATSWTWLVPDEDGVIRANEEVTREEIPKGRKAFQINVGELHPRTRVGWRGAVMPWKYMEDSDTPVFWREPDLF